LRPKPCAFGAASRVSLRGGRGSSHFRSACCTGLGFAGALAEIGLPRSDIPLPLFSFNVGVELGQLAFIAVVLGAIAVAKRIADLP
jgi:hypothetical protein